MKNTVIYSTPSCMYCGLAKAFFKENKIDFTEYNVATDITKRKEMISKTGQMGVPVIDIDGEIIVGFDENRLKEIISKKK